jgi:hypothetical protein
MPKFKVKLNNPTLPEGIEVEVPPLGFLSNKEKAVEVEMEREEAEKLSAAFGVEVSGPGGKVEPPPPPQEEAPVEVTVEEEIEEGGGK